MPELAAAHVLDRLRRALAGEPEPEFVAHVRRLLTELTEREPGLGAADWLARLRLADLYLAWRCARGDELAWRQFEQQVGGLLRAAARKHAANEDAAEEVAGRVRARLFADLGPSPRAEGDLYRYRGQAALKTYVWSVVRSVASRFRREQARLAPAAAREPGSFTRRAPAEELELRERLERLAAALGKAAASLDDKTRLVLQLKHEQGLKQSVIGPMFGEPSPVRVHRCYARIYRQLRERFVAELGEGPPPTVSELSELARNLPVNWAAFWGSDGG